MCIIKWIIVKHLHSANGQNIIFAASRNYRKCTDQVMGYLSLERLH